MATKAWFADGRRPVAKLSLSAVTSTGAGTEFDFGGVYSNLAMQVTISGTTTGATKVILEGCLSTDLGYQTVAGSTWLHTSGNATPKYVTGIPVRFLRATLGTCSTATPVTAYVGVAQ